MFTTTGYHTNFLELPPALIMNASCIQPWCVRPIYSNAYKIGLLCTHKKDWGHMEYHRKSIIFSMDFIKLKRYFNLHVCMSYRASHIISSPYLLQMHCHWQSRAADLRGHTCSRTVCSVSQTESNQSKEVVELALQAKGIRQSKDRSGYPRSLHAHHCTPLARRTL